MIVKIKNMYSYKSAMNKAGIYHTQKLTTDPIISVALEGGHLIDF